MALTNCPECNKQYSNTLASCPHCGYRAKANPSAQTNSQGQQSSPVVAPNKQATKVAKILIAMVIIGILLFGGCSILTPFIIKSSSPAVFEAVKGDILGGMNEF